MAGGDQRDARNWVVLELTHAGQQKVEEGVLAGLLRTALRVDSEYPIFIPVITYVDAGSRVSMYWAEGYVFVASGLPESSYLNLERTKLYVKSVLTTRQNGMRVLSVVSDAKVREIRTQLASKIASDVVAGMQVCVNDGMFNNLEGEVLCVEGEDAHVRITMRSLDLIAKIPRIFLTPPKDTP